MLANVASSVFLIEREEKVIRSTSSCQVRDISAKGVNLLFFLRCRSIFPISSGGSVSMFLENKIVLNRIRKWRLHL